METQQRIKEIIEDRYNGFKGTLFSEIKRNHSFIRTSFGDECYLLLLEKLTVNNPRPVYSIPTEFYERNSLPISNK